MQSADQMAEFVLLWELLQQVQLSSQQDIIRWRWTATGEYTAKSAYEAQLQGTYSNMQGTQVWKAHAEGKIKFFVWLAIQKKVLTAGKLLARN